MTVDAIMSRDVVTVDPDAALPTVRRRLHEHDYRQLLVVGPDEALRGIIDDHDVLRALRPFLTNDESPDEQALDRTAADVMRPDPWTVGPDTSVEEAARLLLDYDISGLPVVADEALVGLVTSEDLLRHYTNEA
jgi:acetoin utilization protein AcuB